MTLPCKGTTVADTGIRTTDIRQTKFGSGEWQTVSGGFRMYFHGTLLIYSKIT